MKRFNKKDAGVSPVIATLVLVLVAVAAGVAFFAWQSSWQEDTTNNIGSGVVKTTITVGGSSTVYPFTAVAADAYMEANPTVEIAFQKGGSGAGIASVRAGAVDIGSASKPVTPSDDYPNEQVFQVGVDAVVVMVPAANTHGFPNGVSLTSEIISTIYLGTNDWNGDGTADFWTTVDFDGTAGNEPETITGGFTWDDLLAAGLATTGGTGDVDLYERSDKSGTEECFAEKIVGKKITTDASVEIDNPLFDSSKQLSSSSIATGEASNQDVVESVGGNADAIGFASFGIADTSSAVAMVNFEGVTPSSDSIEDEIGAEGTGYSAIRPLNYIVEEGASAQILEYINFCLQPQNNIDFNEEADYFPMY